MKRLDADEEKEEMVRFLLELSKGSERIKPDSYLCLSCKHDKPRIGECNIVMGFFGEDFTHGNVYSVICMVYDFGKDWQWLKGKKQWQ